MAILRPLLRGFFSTLLQLFCYGVVYALPCYCLLCASRGLEQGKTWQAAVAAFVAAGLFGLCVDEQQRKRGNDLTPTSLDWGTVGNTLRRALRQEAMALGGTSLVGKVTSRDDMGVLPPPEMFLALKEVDEDAVKRVLEQAKGLQEQEHKEEARRVALRSWRQA